MPAQTGQPGIPFGISTGLAELLQWMCNSIKNLQVELIPPTTVTNLRATAQAGAVQIDFTRSDGDDFILYVNSVPSINLALRVDLGLANKYIDDIGAGGILRYYAVKAKKGILDGQVSPWVSATTLALGTAIVPPAAVPAAEIAFTDQETDAVEIGRVSGGEKRTLPL